MKTAQILLYNQLREDYIYTNYTHLCYIHHIGKIKFEGKNLNLNSASKIIDYAGGKHMIESQQKKGKVADFIISNSFYKGIKEYSIKHNINNFVIIKPVENYVFNNFLKIKKDLEKESIQLEIRDDSHSFFLSHEDFLAQYKKPPIMEYFYRFMRKRENILVDEFGNPEGGEWNYDKENRKFDRKHEKSWDFSLGKNKYLAQAENHYQTSLSFRQPCNREEALKLLDYFLKHHLDNFGSLEDAMYENDPFVHHSFLSSSINYGFLSAKEVVLAVSLSNTAINNKEGFIRQILGWREYMYHFFNFYKDSIYQNNHLNHTRPLPDFFWKDPESCPIKALRVALKQVHTNNTCHHIQRLMVIGNFALLMNLDPHELNRWFFEYYTDAFEWVVTPNVLGMSQFADGGKLATKPYVASANYIHKMSDYYKDSEHNPKEKYTDDSCPYNYLYWCFVDDNKEIFAKGRQQFVLKNLEKVDISRCRELKENLIKDIYK